ncbi:MAG: helix-hairpin-helix domain-containing protein [Chlorobi bacterium]|nr:helix-hairpin-helix domain-containing protein [Chlorobiota bacterium]
MSKLLAKIQEWTHASKQELIAVTTLLGLTTGAAIVGYYRHLASSAATTEWLRRLDSLASVADHADSVEAGEYADIPALSATGEEKLPRHYQPKRPPAQPVNINTASKQQLMQLPGIGEAMAARIIAERQNKPFTTPDELLRVRGIGPKKLEQLRPYIRTTEQ